MAAIGPLGAQMGQYGPIMEVQQTSVEHDSKRKKERDPGVPGWVTACIVISLLLSSGAAAFSLYVFLTRDDGDTASATVSSASAPTATTKTTPSITNSAGYRRVA